MRPEINLHIHTTASDGTCSPQEVVRIARNIGLRAIAVTDHDTAAGVSSAVCEGERLGVEVVSGIELSAKYDGAEVHILGYFIDPEAAALREAVSDMVREREARNRKIAALMQSDGLPIALEDLAARFPKATIGRPHFARALVSLGLAESVPDAFARYLNRGMRYYLPRTHVAMEQAVGIIRQSGGRAVLAHPFQYRLSDGGRVELAERFRDCGGTGIECMYSGYDEGMTAELEEIAARVGLCVTGGSDFHGSVKPEISIGTGKGGLCVPYSVLEKLKLAEV